MNQPSHSAYSASESLMSAERDLLNTIFDPETPYPWEPLKPEADARLDAWTAEFDGEDINAAIATGWSAFSQQLDAQWVAASPATTGLMTRLSTQFQDRIPTNLLQTLATTAKDLVQGGQPVAEQLVTCVSSILPHWDANDLAVLARPMAYSLRDGHNEILDLNLRSIPQTDWESLSTINQARLSLVVASVALKAAAEEE